MGLFASAPSFRLPPDASLVEIRNREVEGPMEFVDGIFTVVPTRQTAAVLAAFDIERRRHIKRVRRLDAGLNEVILSYDASESQTAEKKLRELGIDSAVSIVKLPRWCPLSQKQRDECEKFWPMNDVTAEPELPVDPLDSHEVWLTQVMRDKSVIIRSSDPKNTTIMGTAPCDCDCCDQCIGHGVIKALGDASRAAVGVDGYLCTGLDVYCYREPCVMCAMAMTHSRVGRLFYVEKNGEFGGIESQVQVHCNPCLNHRYRAFRLRM